jgi:NADH:ubiquinone oxidoreductase subunit 2 (subunit N)
LSPSRPTRHRRLPRAAWRGALPAVALAIFLFSLAGPPPLAGFLGKFYVFAAGIQGGMYVPVVIAVLNSVVSLYYYARREDDVPRSAGARRRTGRFPAADLGVVGVCRRRRRSS